jgi:hypothetical protein
MSASSLLFGLRASSLLFGFSFSMADPGRGRQSLSDEIRVSTQAGFFLDFFSSMQNLLDASQEYGSIPSDEHRLKLLRVESYRQLAAEMLLFLADAYSTSEGTVVHSLVLLDRFLATCTPDTASGSGSSQLIHGAIASFLISVKLREVSHPLLRDLERLTSCSCEQIIASEEMVLKSLDWDVHSVSGKKKLKLN